MRITEHAPERLVLREGTAFISTLLVLAGLIPGEVAASTHQGGPLIATGVFILLGLFFFRIDRVGFDRVRRTVLIDHWSILRKRTIRVAFDDIEDVIIERGPSPSGAARPSTRLVLATRTGAQPLSSVYSASSRFHAPVCRAILDFLNKHVPAASAFDWSPLASREPRSLNNERLTRGEG